MTLTQGIDLVLLALLMVLVVVLGTTVSRLRSLEVSLETTLSRMQSELSHLVDEAVELVDNAGEDVSKFEVLLDAANVATSSMGNVSKIAYTVVASPVVKAKAFRAGMSRFAGVFKPQTATRKGRR